MTKLYGGIDLHANNSVIVLVDDQERVVYEQRVPHDLGSILFHLHLFNHVFTASSWNQPIIGIGWLMGSWKPDTRCTWPTPPRFNNKKA